MTPDRIPVIDLTRDGSTVARDAIDAACREWGFFQVVGHGIDAQLLGALQRQVRAFFALPVEAKRAVSRSEENPWGYYDRELTKNTRDWKEIFDFAAMSCGRSVPRWPSGLPGFEETLVDYYRACENVAARLLRIISNNLGMAPDALDGYFARGHSSFTRLNHYPVCANPARPAGLTTPTEGHLGVNYHTDPGAVTLLLQDEQPGLEVFRNGRWSLVEPLRDALVVNVGDIVQVWSNDQYRAPLHRVVTNASAERFSIVFFYCPSYASDYAPLASTVDARHPPRYRGINWGHFYAMRTKGDYADHGEEIQISQFRT
jgi:isopenicillin N synthase-like dioxygenase